jgi:hypothetical protein
MTRRNCSIGMFNTVYGWYDFAPGIRAPPTPAAATRTSTAPRPSTHRLTMMSQAASSVVSTCTGTDFPPAASTCRAVSEAAASPDYA